MVAILVLMGAVLRAQSSSISADNGIFPSRDASYVPPNGKQRWHIYLHDNFEIPGAYFRALGASIGEHYPAKPAAWPSGPAGYFADVGSQFGRFTIGGTIDAVAASALRYEPRYLPCNCHGPPRRVGHAVLRTFLTYDHDGRRVPDLPGLAGNYGGSILMMYWYPSGYGSISRGIQAGNFSLAIQGVVNVVKEFAPDIRDTIGRKKIKRIRVPN